MSSQPNNHSSKQLWA